MLISSFLLLFALAFIGFAVYGLLVNRQSSISKRLRNLQAPAATRKINRHHKKDENANPFEKFLAENIRVYNKLHVNISPKEIIMLNTGSAFSVFLIGFVFMKQIPAAALFGLLGFFLPYLVGTNIIKTKQKAFERLFGDALVLIANILKSGFSLKQGFQIVADEMPPAVAEEFATINQELTWGLDLPEVMNNLNTRMPNEYVKLFVTAINIQSEVGGSMAEVIGKIAENIQKKQQMQGDLKALTSQGKSSGVIVGLLPFAVGGLVFVINPAYISTLFTTTIGIVLLVVAGVMEAIGAFVIKAITTVE